MSIQTLHRRSTGGNLRMNMNSVPVHMRNLLQYKHVCSYCRRTGHNEEDCILHNVDSEVDKENVLPKTTPSPSSLFYSSHYSTKKRTITIYITTEHNNNGIKRFNIENHLSKIIILKCIQGKYQCS